MCHALICKLKNFQKQKLNTHIFIDKNCSNYEPDGQQRIKNIKPPTTPCEILLVLKLNLDTLVFKFHHTWCGMFYVQSSTEHFTCNIVTVIYWTTPELLKIPHLHVLKQGMQQLFWLVTTWRKWCHTPQIAGSPQVHPCPGLSLT